MAVRPSAYERTRCHRLGWVLERTGWWLLLAAATASLLGVFGDGWLSDVEVRAESLTVRYARVGRARTPLELVLTWSPDRQETELAIARSYLDGFEIVEVLPPPARTAADSRRVYYTFHTRDPRARFAVRLKLRPLRAGRFTGGLGVEDRSQLAVVRQLILP